MISLLFIAAGVEAFGVYTTPDPFAGYALGRGACRGPDIAFAYNLPQTSREACAEYCTATEGCVCFESDDEWTPGLAAVVFDYIIAQVMI